MIETESGFAEINGAWLYYEVAGDGHPLILIHAGICDSRMWDKQMPVFAQHYRMIRYDMRGFGRSRMPPGAFSHSADARALLQFLGVERAYVIGASMGGKVAMELTLLYPSMVGALVLAAPAVPGRSMSALWEQRDAEIDEAIDAGDFDRAVELELRLWVDGPTRAPDQVDSAVRERVRAMNSDIYAHADEHEHAAPQSFGTPLAEHVSDIRVPMLIIVGDHDVPDFQENAVFLEREIGGAQRLVSPGTAHLPSMEQPERFNEVVLGFLSKL